MVCEMFLVKLKNPVRTGRFNNAELFDELFVKVQKDYYIPYFFVFKDLLSSMFNDDRKGSQYKSQFLKRLVNYYEGGYYNDVDSVYLTISRDKVFMTIVPLLVIGGKGVDAVLQLVKSDKKSLHILSSFLNSLHYYLRKSESDVYGIMMEFTSFEVNHRKKYHKGTKLFEDILFTLILYTYMYLRIGEYVFFSSTEDNVYRSGIVDAKLSKVVGVINESYTCIYHKYDPLIVGMYNLPNDYVKLVCDKDYRIAKLKDLNTLFSLFYVEKSYKGHYLINIPEDIINSKIGMIRVDDATGMIVEKQYKVSVYFPKILILKNVSTGDAVLYPLVRKDFSVFINIDKLKTPIEVKIKYSQGSNHAKVTLPWSNVDDMIEI